MKNGIKDHKFVMDAITAMQMNFVFREFVE